MWYIFKEVPMKNIESMLFKTLGILLALSMVLLLSTATASAQTYPTRPIRFVVPVLPGGAQDIMARLIAPRLSKQLGVPVFVENHGGAAQILGSEIVARSAPDGHTLCLVSAGLAVTASFYKLPYDPVESFVPIAKVPSGDMLLVTHPSVPVNSVKDLIALAKKQPGKLIFASGGVGSFGHMAIELFKSMTGIDFKIVQFRAVAPAIVDVVGGHSQATITGGIAFVPYIKPGTLKALGMCGKTRSILFPDVPTIAEAGVPGFEASSWHGILVAAGTPQAIVDRLHNELSVILSSAEMKKQLAAQGAELDKMMTIAEFRSFIAAEVVKWQRVVKEANIKVEQ
jgi:tripartite-type tricarboxylate transporter receptor subunit TctC